MAPLFGAQGFAVVDMPLVELRPIAGDACGTRQVRRLAGGEPVLLTSAFATDLWLDLRESEFREHTPRAYYVVGRRSARLLAESDPDVPIAAVAESGEQLLTNDFQDVRTLLYPCSTARRDAVVDALVARGIDVVELPLYSPALPDGARERLAGALAADARPVAIVFFSPSAVDNFFRLSPVIPSGAIFGAIGETTAGVLRAHGVASPVVAEHPDPALLARMLAHVMP